MKYRIVKESVVKSVKDEWLGYIDNEWHKMEKSDIGKPVSLYCSVRRPIKAKKAKVKK